VLAHEVSSQIDVHKEWGGVVPMLAKREHARNLPEILARIMNNELGIKVDLIAVTYGPGLEPALWEGINFAEELATKWGVPIVAVDHMAGHIASAIIKPQIPKIQSSTKSKISSSNLSFELCDLEFPAIALLISGGHTELVLLKNLNNLEIIGQTRDDAVGEAFDKVARMMGEPYPGGPRISALAEKFQGSNPKYQLPRPMINSKDLDFSFSGLKTAVLYLVKSRFDLSNRGSSISQAKSGKINELTEEEKIEIAYEFEQAVTDVLVKKTYDAIKQYNVKSLLVGGGVIANKSIRTSLGGLASKLGINLYLPDQKFTGDNATMIGIAALLRLGFPPSHKASGGHSAGQGYQHPEHMLHPGTKPFEELRASGNLALYK